MSDGNGSHKSEDPVSLMGRIMARLIPKPAESENVREVIEGLIEDTAEESGPNDQSDAIDTHERLLLGNVLKLRDVTAVDIMVPRADIIALDADTPMNDVFRIATREGHSRYPVFRETLDDVIGMVHIKDLAKSMTETGGAVAYEGAEDAGQSDLPVKLAQLVRKILFVSPAARVLDLLLQMRQQRTHMALVVDEHGGIDGLVTIEDIVEQIVGDIEDEHDTEQEAELVEKADGSAVADGRLTLTEFEQRFGALFSAEERDEADTMAGLVARLAGRVPARNELVKHPSGMEFEIVDADARRVKRLRIRHIPRAPAGTDADDSG
ncbi:MAG: HlyC/CorC family transporter [Rhodobacteraceae bacterium]|nr:HlyC/CorC family transporter [Paracoccaceae bacterium]